ncbi:TonB-linked outer membrane protein, SusC/RagA family [Chitinophaga sp. YR573]|uniref:SusC/RagA family TonB-linked outer membrane protein n=1 Tax=Chitinophaga sp. YR573 TaxID=1881040 RepID=UPI0008B1193F|nr:TonB-dependent receptor [Chitinophaga sp. YR573]SEW02878.1 TonB-linked outer membrane protein, SusC/RagA family [Chitinophaga sp. YR573]
MKNTLLRAGAMLLCLLVSGTLIRAQSSMTIKGKVTATDGTPVIGASIAVKGQKTGTASDTWGNYKLDADRNSVLIVSFIGFLSQEVPVNGRGEINIQLSADQKKLDEVVVVGYGQQKKKDVTGAISSISSKSIMEVPVTNAQQALQGRTPGIEVINNSNKPGDEPRVRVRGTRSLSAGNDPLYVVDGIPFAGNLNDINPQDIASMDILKDASATAIYGSRGANGVVLVSTRKGKNGKPVVTYNGVYGSVHNLGRTDMMDSQQYIGMKREAYRTSGIYDDSNPTASDAKIFNTTELANIKKGVNTDWQSLLISPGWQTRHSLGVSGGTEKTKYAISGGYFKDQGVLKLQSYERYNLHVAVDQQIGSRIHVGASTLATYSMRKGATYNGMDAGLKMLPIGTPYDSTGKLITYPTGDNQQPNPLLDYVPGNRVENLSHLRLFNSLYGEVTIAEGLKYRLNLGGDIMTNNNGLFQGKNNTNLLIGGGDATAQKSNQFIWAYTVENVATYSKVFNKKHSLNITGLYSVQRQREDTSSASVRGIPVEWQQYYNLGQAANVTAIGSQLGTWTILSYMGRLNYGYDDRYLITLTLRSDGSSRFAPGHKWGYFPSVALGWNITNEQFMKNVKFVDNLKLRGSYGRIGNTGIPPYATQGLLGRAPYSFGNKGSMGFNPILIRNPNLTWETTASTNIGIDFSVLKGRLTGTVDVYKQKTTDLLLQRFLPYSNGFDYVLENTGVTQNKGIEIGLSAVIVEAKDFSWTMDVNAFKNSEKILALGEGKKQDVGNGWFVGSPTYVYYDYKKVGIWQTEAEAQVYKQHMGEIRLADLNNDKKLDDKDRSILGTPQPNWSGGMTQRFTYKNIDLSVVAFARFGGMIKSDFYSTFNTLQGRYNNLDIHYFTPSNPTNDFPRPNSNQERPNNYNTLSYFDGSYFKIRNITLGYSMPKRIMDRWKMDALRFSVDVKQPLILAPYRQKYKGIDPEDVNTIAVDAPATWMLQFGINATF